MFKMCDFWMYSINLGVLIHKGASVSRGLSTCNSVWEIYICSAPNFRPPLPNLTDIGGGRWVVHGGGGSVLQVGVGWWYNI